MALRTAATQARSELGWLCRQEVDWRTLAEQASAVISRVVAHERFCYHPGERGVRLVAVGAVPGGTDARPEHFSLARQR